MKVNYVSACFDNSGYAEAARNNIAALAEAGVNIHVNPVSFESFKSDLGLLGQKCQALVRKDSDARIRIIHTTPNIFHKFYRADGYNIGYTTWETTNLPKDWAENINLMDEVWVPCTQNVEIFRSSGVKIPIFVMPHTFNIPLMESESISTPLQNINSDDFVFYSIFQWTVRKGPLDLLKAYLTEFKGNEKVALVLKCYWMNPNEPNDKDRIKNDIVEIKQRLFLDNYPKIILIPNLLSRSQVFQIHKSGHCYLSFHKNEGFGIPIVEAMAVGNPTIVTNYGGVTDYIDNNNSYPISYQETPVYGMPWPTYKGDQVWADINIMEARKAMRRVFSDREEGKLKGRAGKVLIENEYSWAKIGNLMKQRLLEIEQKGYKNV